MAMPVRADDTYTFCRVLEKYAQPPGVAYVPGVDVGGRPVVPADAEGAAPLPQFDSIEVPVTVDLIQKFGLSAPAGIELKPYVALISIHKDGRVNYNGQDVTAKAENVCEQESKVLTTEGIEKNKEK